MVTCSKVFLFFTIFDILNQNNFKNLIIQD